jgi:signal transduction histidine kinase
VNFRDATIKQKLTWMSTLASTIALLLSGGAFVGYHFIASRNALARILPIRADIIGLNSIASLRFDDERSASQTLSALRGDKNIARSAIYDADGRLFATYLGAGERSTSIAPAISPHQEDAAVFSDGALVVYHAIVADGERLGTVYLSYKLDDLFRDVARYVIIALVVLVVSLCAAVLAASRIQNSFTQPIARLVKAATAVSREKDYRVRVEPTRTRDELGALIDTFNEMLVQIQIRDEEVQAGKTRFQQLSEELEVRVQRRTAELEETNKELEAFTYSVSHDLRAPLRRIDGFANLLMTEYGAQLTDEAAHYLSRVREGTRHMGQLVDDLLNLGRVCRKDLKLQVAGLSAIAEGVVNVLKRETRERVIEWKIQSLPFAECDPALMEVVFTNLLSNAVKYTRPRERAVIEVGSFEKNGCPVIFVRDNGVGFSMKYADKLFGVFQRLHRVEDFEGTGVGLATVQRILHKHGGEIWAEADLDKGACFFFTIGTSPQLSAIAS